MLVSEVMSFREQIRINGLAIGVSQPVFIVAEAGLAHFGKLEKAFELVDLAVKAGADAVKFQIFRTDELISPESIEWRDRLRPKELPLKAFSQIKDYCESKNIIFFATAHDEYSLQFLDLLNPPMYKVGSGELQNWNFIKDIALRRKPVIVSTGMYGFEDVQQVVNIFKEANNPSLMLLHCVTAYPTQPADVNLMAIAWMRDTFGVITGYSDHTRGIHFPVAAVALGAKIIEKHIALDFNVPNAQDWKVACNRRSLTQLVRQIRDIEAGIGNGQKRAQISESGSVSWARKSIVSKTSILPGQLITVSMLQFQRPGTGIAPCDIGQVIGRRAKIQINPGTVIRESMLR